MDAESLKVYHDRAAQLADAMRLCQDDLSAYASAAALLAVHSCISYCDAVLIQLGGWRSRHEDHKQAAALVKRACKKIGIDGNGIAHLEKLLSAKTDISYGDKLIDSDQIARYCIAPERFHRWAERILHKGERPWR